MATEHPRQYVWSGDPGSPITFLISIGNSLSSFDYYLARSSSIITAIASVVSRVTPIDDDWNELMIICRPLHRHEVDKVSLDEHEIVKLDEDSQARLIEEPTDGEEDHDRDS